MNGPTEVKRPKRSLKTFGLDRNLEKHTVMIDVVLRIFQNESLEGVAEELTNVEVIRLVRVSE
jgi:hypothetical protein